MDTVNQIPPIAQNGRVFLCAGNDWGRHPSSLTHIFKIIARTEPVIWINSIGQRSPRLARKDFLRLWGKGRNILFRPVYVPEDGEAGAAAPSAVIEPKVLPYHQYHWVRRLNSAILAHQLAPFLQKWRGQAVDFIFVTSNPGAVDVIGRLEKKLSIYYCMDEYAEMGAVDPKMIRTCEPLMLEAVDCTFATSLNLCQSKTSRRYETLHLPQGVDFAHFQDIGACPEPLRRLPRPIIGLQGIIGEWTDLTLLEKVLQSFPEASVVTLGRCEVNLERLRRYPNFHAFDAVPYAQLPAWAGRFDIGLISYVKSDHIKNANPLKLLEYLAMGQPVVSTDLPELALHRDYLYIAADYATYLSHVQGLVQRYPFPQAERERLKAYAAKHTWERRAARFLEVCDTLRRQKTHVPRGKQAPMASPTQLDATSPALRPDTGGAYTVKAMKAGYSHESS